jgi:hypothetical protein
MLRSVGETGSLRCCRIWSTVVVHDLPVRLRFADARNPGRENPEGVRLRRCGSQLGQRLRLFAWRRPPT